MKNSFFSKFLVLASLLLVFLSSSTVFAGTVVSISNVQFYPNCTGNFGELIMTFDWEKHEEITSVIDRRYVNGVLHSESIDNQININFWNSINGVGSIKSYAHGFPAAVPNTIYTWEITWNGEKYSWSWNCTTGEQYFGSSSSGEDSLIEPIYPPDNRLNPTFGDANIAILYPNEAGGIDIYLYEGQSYISNFISEDDLVAGFTRSEGLVTVLVLEDNRIQFTLGADSEGKIFTFIMDDLAGSNLVGDYYDPNQ